MKSSKSQTDRLFSACSCSPSVEEFNEVFGVNEEGGQTDLR